LFVEQFFSPFCFIFLANIQKVSYLLN
jgi:hypothetical protein